MIAALIALVYITLLCFITGRSLVKDQRAGILDCFTGLAFHGILFTAFSLFIPVGTITAQVVAIGVTLGLFLWRRPQLTPWPLVLHRPIAACCCIAALIILLMLNAAPVNHGDTLIYHAQNIRWSAAYRAIPGLANLEYHLGLQSSMFVVSALFSFPFTGNAGLGFANLAVCSWLVLFVFIKLEEQVLFRAQLPWILLAGFLFWSYTQARLSVSSGSVDFIASVFSWLILYRISVTPATSRARLLEFILLIVFATSIKFSVAPLLLLIPYLLLRSNERPAFKFLLLPFASVCLLIPILTRNTITSGYPLLPSESVSFDVDWKIDPEEASLQRQYIRGYARTGVEADASSIRAAAKESISEWLPNWWPRLSAADKALLISLLLFAPLAIAAAIRRPREVSSYITLTTIAGCVFWFVMAPDPRFGYGFLIPLAAAGLTQLRLPEVRTTIIRNSFLAIMLLCLAAFGGYRIINFFSSRELLTPAGIPGIAFHQIDCNGIRLFVPDVENSCGDSPLPCGINCENIEPRGPRLTNGFRQRKK